MASLSEILKREFAKGTKSKAYAANVLRVSERTVENYINGTRSPKPEALIKLAEMLGFSLSEMSTEVQNVPHETLPNHGRNYCNAYLSFACSQFLFDSKGNSFVSF